MTMPDRAALSEEAHDIADDLEALQDRFAALMRDVRRFPGGQLAYDRVDAYPGIRLDREMGLDRDALAWVALVAGFLDGTDGGGP